MYCPKCGTPNPDDFLYCMRCGTQLREPAPEEEDGSWSDVYLPPEADPKDDLPPVRFYSFRESIRAFWHNYANFSGRATRCEFFFAWFYSNLVSHIAALTAFFVTLILMYAIRGGYDEAFYYIAASILHLPFVVVIIIPMLSVIWRRLHDMGKRGVWGILFIVPFGQYFLLAWLSADSDGDNRFGPRKVDPAYIPSPSPNP